MTGMRVVLAEDDVLRREGLASLLERSGFQLVGQDGVAAQLLGAVPVAMAADEHAAAAYRPPWLPAAGSSSSAVSSTPASGCWFQRVKAPCMASTAKPWGRWGRERQRRWRRVSSAPEGAGCRPALPLSGSEVGRLP
jgi:hypothetical protein